jgi:phosphatidylserine decarboxylase
MTVRSQVLRLFEQEDINFLLTNRIPRRVATQFMGWFSRIEQPLVRDVSLGVWRLFADLDLSDAEQSQFRSLHDCFTRKLRHGARPIDWRPEIVVSPCDALLGAFGQIEGTRLYQIKGFPYSLEDLLGDGDLIETYRNGRYATLRLTSSMYHRFHAPHDCRVERVTYISGDTWNVNPIALKRIENLFCKNERAILKTTLSATGHAVTMVPVAAVLVASIRLHFLDVALNVKHRGPNVFPCSADFKKGEEMGYFEHGSTIIVFAPHGFTFSDGLREGDRLKMGQPLMRLP